MVAVLVGSSDHRTVTPFDGPYVIIVDTWEDAGARNAVLRLCHIIEAGVIHDTGCMTVFLHPFLVAQAVYRHRAAGTEVMAQAQGVAHLVRRNKADQFAHQFLVEVHFLCGLINASGLYHIPVVQQIHHIVIPADVAFQNLTGAWVVYVRSVGILHRGGQIADYRVACVFHAHGRVVFGPFLTDDGILEAGLLESFLPVVDTGDEVFSPLFRSGRVNVIHNRFDGFHQFAAFHLFHIFGAWFQTPAYNETLALDALLVVGELVESVSEITYTRIEVTAHHRLFGQQDERDVQSEGGASG